MTKPTTKKSAPTLKELSLNVVVDNFTNIITNKSIPQELYHEIVSKLSVDISPLISARFVTDEGYWKRACYDKYPKHECHTADHGGSWRRLFFERFLTLQLESFQFDENDNTDNDITEILNMIDTIKDYVYKLTFKQLPSHLDLSDVITRLSYLETIDITYGYTNIGMNYDRLLFGIKMSDAKCLATAISQSNTIRQLSITESLIDDDILRVLMTGLYTNKSINHIDLSHNKISDQGARLLAKLLVENKDILLTLNISDNNIQTDGGKYLARALYDGGELQELNLRLNQLSDVGCQYIFESLWTHTHMKILNISSNGASAQV